MLEVEGGVLMVGINELLNRMCPPIVGTRRTHLLITLLVFCWYVLPDGSLNNDMRCDLFFPKGVGGNE